MELSTIPGTFAICRLGADDAIPPRVANSRFVAIARTADELSIVCAEDLAPAGARVEPGWRCVRVQGPLPFEATGIMASLVTPLATASIPIFAISTFDTDYLLFKDADRDRAVEALRAAGHAVAVVGW